MYPYEYFPKCIMCKKLNGSSAYLSMCHFSHILPLMKFFFSQSFVTKLLTVLLVCHFFTRVILNEMILIFVS